MWMGLEMKLTTRTTSTRMPAATWDEQLDLEVDTNQKAVHSILVLGRRRRGEAQLLGQPDALNPQEPISGRHPLPRGRREGMELGDVRSIDLSRRVDIDGDVGVTDLAREAPPLPPPLTSVAAASSHLSSSPASARTRWRQGRGPDGDEKREHPFCLPQWGEREKGKRR